MFRRLASFLRRPETAVLHAEVSSGDAPRPMTSPDHVALAKRLSAAERTIQRLESELLAARLNATLDGSTDHYDPAASEDLLALGRRIEQSWSDDVAWSVRTEARDYDTTPDFVRLTGLVERAIKSGGYKRVVEIGCGDARYLAYLKNRIGGEREWIATDIDGPRIRKAMTDVPQVSVKAMDILDCQREYNKSGSLFVSANVFGNITPEVILEFFKKMSVPGTGLVFLAGGLPLDQTRSFVVRPNGIAFDHHFFKLVRASGLVVAEYVADLVPGSRSAGYWISCSIPAGPDAK